MIFNLFLSFNSSYDNVVFGKGSSVCSAVRYTEFFRLVPSYCRLRSVCRRLGEIMLGRREMTLRRRLSIDRPRQRCCLDGSASMESVAD